jgi:predicted DNA-binding WGR domain protein
MRVLHRRDPDRNMHRFYALSLQPGLFGTVSVVKEWGRIGQPGTVRHEVYADENAAIDALTLRLQKKLKRGYHVRGQGSDHRRPNKHADLSLVGIEHPTENGEVGL